MTIELLIVLCYLVALSLSFIGWGMAVLSLCGESAHSWGSSGAVGVAFVIGVGGLLNMAGLIKRPVLLSFLCIGISLFLLFFLRISGRSMRAWFVEFKRLCRRPLLVLLCVLLVCISAFRVYGSLRSSGYYGFPAPQIDDRQGYFAFPEKMLALGSYAADPFSEKRIVSNMGGGILLSTFPLLVQDDARSHSLMDQGVGFLLLLLACAGLLRELRVETSVSLFFLLCVAATSIYALTTSICLVGTALLMSCVLLMGKETDYNSDSYGKAIVIGLVMGALCTCKSTFIAPVACLFLCFIVLALVEAEKRGRILLIHLATAIVALLVVFPWAYEMKRTSGTALYPYLGRGYHASAYSLAPLLSENFKPDLIRKLMAIEVPLWIAFAWMLWKQKNNDLMDKALAAATGAGALAILLVAYATGGAGFRRYIVPFTMVAVWAVFLYLLRPNASDVVTNAFNKKTAFAVALLALFTAAQVPSAFSTFSLAARITRLNLPLVSAQERDSAKAAQGSVPPGAEILINVDNPFIYNFSRNSILLEDWPGSAGPPPGPPLGKGPEALASYLLNHSVRYIMFSDPTRTAAGKVCAHPLDVTNPSFDPWIQVECIAMEDIESNFVALGKTRRRIFDDGHNLVLDLAQTTSSTLATSVP